MAVTVTAGPITAIVSAAAKAVNLCDAKYTIQGNSVTVIRGSLVKIDCH